MMDLHRGPRRAFCARWGGNVRRHRRGVRYFSAQPSATDWVGSYCDLPAFRRAAVRIAEVGAAGAAGKARAPKACGYFGLGTTIGGVLMPSASGVMAATPVGPFVFWTAPTSQVPSRFSAIIVIRPNRCGRAEPSAFLSP